MRRAFLTVCWATMGVLAGALEACAQEPGAGDPILAAAILEEGPAEPVRVPRPCVVTRVVDGDTLDCEGVGRVRLIGMDTPERDQQPFGADATAALAELAPVGSTVLLEPDVEAKDRYGRTLAYVWREGVMANWALVRAGYALAATYPPNVQYVERFREAQETARAERAGLWAVDGFACPPAEHRRGRCG